MSNFTDVLQKNKGYDAFNKKEKDIEERIANRSKDWINRFWLKPNGEAKVIFLDDDPIVLEEHQLKVNGDWRNWFTCRRILNEPCILCDELKDTPSTVGFYTVVDLTEYTDKKGNVHKNTIKLFAPKFKALQVIKRLSMKRKEAGHDGIALCVFDVFRSSGDAYNVGDVFTFEAQTTWDEVKVLNPEAAVLDYLKILEPKTNAELKQLLSKNTAANSEYGMDEDDVPF